MFKINKSVISFGLYIFCLLPLPSMAQTNLEMLSSIAELNRLAFGSCNKHRNQQPLWNEMASLRPDLFVWGGDNVYGDKEGDGGIDQIKKAYDIQNKVQDYVSFKSQVPFVGLWDDHDYGKNNGGYEYLHKEISQNLFLDFMEVSRTSPRRQQRGIYNSYTFGEAGKKIKLILLDNRFFKDIKKGALLGKAQWSWLENEVKKTDANLLLIFSGISVLSPLTIHSEEWKDYPKEKIRLRKLMKSTGIPYIYLAGDKHFSSIFSEGNELEFLSSGMTHNSELVVQPWIRSKYPTPVFKHNYGLIDFSWEHNARPVLKLSIRGEEGKIFQEKVVTWINSHWLEL